MKKSVVLLALTALLSCQTFASNCFVAKEKNFFLKNKGHCNEPHAPCSTFKIAISLMGYNEGILIDENTPVFPFKSGYADFVDSWKQSQTPTTWIKNSCLWYSQIITQKLGMPVFKSYVTKFQYGNQDVTGDKGLNNGLTQSWLSSSLQITPMQQITFLNRLITSDLPVSLKAQTLTRKLLFIDNLPNGWKLYGKTGTGYQLGADGSRNKNRQIGWFVGWIEKDARTITFAQFIEDKEAIPTPAGLRAKTQALEKISQMIQAKLS